MMKPTNLIVDPKDGKEYRVVGEVRIEHGIIVIDHCSLREIMGRHSEPVLSQREKQHIYGRCVDQLIIIAGAQEKERENVASYGKQARVRHVRRSRLHPNRGVG